MFYDLVKTAEEHLRKVNGAALGAHSRRWVDGRPLRVATMCSGTESPLLALDLICKALYEQTGVGDQRGARLLVRDRAVQAGVHRAQLRAAAALPRHPRARPRRGDDRVWLDAYGAGRRGHPDRRHVVRRLLEPQHEAKGIDQKGESGQTFWGMLGWVRRHRPPIVIQENVCGAPWDQMKSYYAKEGYGGDLPARRHEAALRAAHAHARLPPRGRHDRARPPRAFQ